MRRFIFMNLKKKWTDHLQDNHMTYGEHRNFAMFYGIHCFMAGFYLIVHAIFPCFFQRAGSNLIIKLAEQLKNR